MYDLIFMLLMLSHFVCNRYSTSSLFAIAFLQTLSHFPPLVNDTYPTFTICLIYLSHIFRMGPIPRIVTHQLTVSYSPIFLTFPESLPLAYGNFVLLSLVVHKTSDGLKICPTFLIPLFYFLQIGSHFASFVWGLCSIFRFFFKFFCISLKIFSQIPNLSANIVSNLPFVCNLWSIYLETLSLILCNSCRTFSCYSQSL